MLIMNLAKEGSQNRKSATVPRTKLCNFVGIAVCGKYE
jgi:hypothetical protein